MSRSLLTNTSDTEVVTQTGTVAPARSPAADPATRALGLADDLLEAIGTLRRQVRRSAGRPWAPESLTVAQSELVRLLRRSPGISVAEAAAMLHLAPNSVSTLVRQLSDVSLVVRGVDSSDRRLARLDLTPAARDILERWRDGRAQRVAEGLDRLSAAERTQLAMAATVLKRLADEVRNGEDAE